MKKITFFGVFVLIWFMMGDFTPDIFAQGTVIVNEYIWKNERAEYRVIVIEGGNYYQNYYYRRQFYTPYYRETKYYVSRETVNYSKIYYELEWLNESKTE